LISRDYCIEQFAVLFVALLVAAVLVAMNSLPGWLEAAYVYDAANDIVPDWLWDAGIPGNSLTQ